ncbi:hypothetical protein [Klebsiella pneumoniae]|uniref:hypothetical protein n=1 Tax=Klebsiella pneumoniae TaxID=573 RepID=UPI0022F37F92|nr:hypothetical protein [Klebsiella pneumoniae]WBX45438.1 hypothetical protein MWR71_30320 [Klebsiella pneumoniae]
MMKSIGMYDDGSTATKKSHMLFTGENPQWEQDKPTGMTVRLLSSKVERFAIGNSVPGG